MVERRERKMKRWTFTGAKDTTEMTVVEAITEKWARHLAIEERWKGIATPRLPTHDINPGFGLTLTNVEEVA